MAGPVLDHRDMKNKKIDPSFESPQSQLEEIGLDIDNFNILGKLIRHTWQMEFMHLLLLLSVFYYVTNIYGVHTIC